MINQIYNLLNQLKKNINLQYSIKNENKND